MSESRRPGRHRAGSSCSGLLVAPMTNTFFFEVMPSISGKVSQDARTHWGGYILTSQELVDDTVRSTTGIANGTATGLGNRVQLVEEDNAGSGRTRLVEDVADVAFRLTKPHAEQLRTLDRDEVGGALVGDGLGQHGFTGTRGAIEEDTPRRGEAKLEEHFGVVDGVLDALPEVLLDALETTNILPANVGHLDNGNLAQGGGVGNAEGEAEVFHGDAQRVEDLGINGVFVEVDEVHLLTNLLHGSLGAQSGNIGTDVTVGLGGNLLQVNVVAKLHVFGVDLENLESAGRVRDANVHLTVKAAKSSQGRVNRVGPIRGGHDNDIGAGLHAVHEREELRDDTSLDLAVCLFTLGRD